MDQITKQKIEMWQKKLNELQKELEQIMIRRGEAAREGDLRENAAFQMADEDANTYRVRIKEVEKIIDDLKKAK